MGIVQCEIVKCFIVYYRTVQCEYSEYSLISKIQCRYSQLWLYCIMETVSLGIVDREQCVYSPVWI